MNKLRVALIWPPGYHPTIVVPLPFAYLISNTKPELWEYRFIDCTRKNYTATSEDLAREIQDFDPHIVGISTWSPMFPKAHAVARSIKRNNPEIVVVLGGSHATAYPERTMEHSEFDFLFCGESEFSFPTFLEEFSRPEPDYGRVKGLAYRTSDGKVVINEMDRIEELDQISPPDYRAIDLPGYLKDGYRWNTPRADNAPIWVTRGCPYRCTFCNAPLLNGKPLRHHSAEYMMAWIRQLHEEFGTQWFNIIDDNFTFNRQFAKIFCRTVIDSGIKNLGFATPNGVRMQKGDRELWQLMKTAGWRSIMVAPETGSQRVLDIMKKDLDLKIVPGVIEDMKAAGLKVQGTFIIGYPGETTEDLMMTSQFIKNCGFDLVMMNNFQPLPGTPIYDDLVAQGEIKDGLLPKNYSDGSRPYIPPELRGFNFSSYVLKIHLGIMLRTPANLLYIFSLFSVRHLLNKIFAQSIRAIVGSTPKPEQP